MECCRWVDEPDLLHREPKSTHVGAMVRPAGRFTRSGISSIDRTSVHNVLSRTVGFRPPERTRSSSTLSLSEREEISRSLASGESLRSIAARMRRALRPSVAKSSAMVGREGYRATQLSVAAWERAHLRPQALQSLHDNRALASLVADKLRLRWFARAKSRDGSSILIRATRATTCPTRNHLSQPVHSGARRRLKKELMEHLRSARAAAPLRGITRRKLPSNGKIADAVSISERPRHRRRSSCAGPLAARATMFLRQRATARSQTLVERQTRYLMLVKARGQGLPWTWREGGITQGPSRHRNLAQGTLAPNTPVAA
jgi:IS30 family transposase